MIGILDNIYINLCIGLEVFIFSESKVPTLSRLLLIVTGSIVK